VFLRVSEFDPQKTDAKAMNTTVMRRAHYFGIQVQVSCQMTHCSLIHFNDRSFVVETADLVLEQNFTTAKCASIDWAAA